MATYRVSGYIEMEIEADSEGEAFTLFVEDYLDELTSCICIEEMEE